MRSQLTDACRIISQKGSSWHDGAKPANGLERVGFACLIWLWEAKVGNELGHPQKKNLNVSFCSFVCPWELLTEAHKRGLTLHLNNFQRNSGKILPGKSGLSGADWRLFTKKSLTRVSKRVPGVHGKRGWRGVGRKGWRRVGLADFLAPSNFGIPYRSLFSGNKKTVPLVNHAFARGTPAIFVIFVVSRGLSSKTLVLLTG